MVTADARHHHVTLSVTSRYDGRYLSEVVQPALGRSVAPLVSGRRGARKPQAPPPTAARVLRVNLRVSKPDLWRYEEVDSSGTLVTASGCDGHHRWTLSEGRLRTWPPRPPRDVYSLPGSAWQNAPHRPLREILDPVLALPTLTIERTEPVQTPYGPAVRLHGTPRPADVVESALVSPWADLTVLDVHAEAGVVLAASNTRGGDWVLVTHDVTGLDLDARHDPALFQAPSAATLDLPG